MHFANFVRCALEYTLSCFAWILWLNIEWNACAVVESEQIDMIHKGLDLSLFNKPLPSQLFSPCISYSFFPPITLFCPASPLLLHFFLHYFPLFFFPLMFLMLPAISFFPYSLILPSEFLSSSTVHSGPGPVCKMPALQRRTQLCGEVPWWVAGSQQFHLQIRQSQQWMSSLPCQLHPGVRAGWFIKLTCACVQNTFLLGVLEGPISLLCCSKCREDMVDGTWAAQRTCRSA